MMADLADKTIIVGGGTGDVGHGIVAVLTEAGARVLVPARDAQKAESLRAYLNHPERLDLLPPLPADEAGVASMRARLAEFGPLDGAVASLGSWFAFGSLMETRADQIQTAFESLLRSHILFARSAVPSLVPGASYIAINGAGSKAPVPHSSAVSIMAHGVDMVTATVRAEHPGLRVHTLMLDSVIATRARLRPDPSWVTAREVGEAAAMLLTSTGQPTSGTTVTLTPKPRMRAQPDLERTKS